MFLPIRSAAVAFTSSVDVFMTGSTISALRRFTGCTSKARLRPGQVFGGGASRSITRALETASAEVGSLKMVNSSPKSAVHDIACDKPPVGQNAAVRHGIDTRNRLAMVTRVRDAMTASMSWVRWPGIPAKVRPVECRWRVFTGGRYVCKMPIEESKRFHMHDTVLVAGMGIVLGLLALSQIARSVDTAEVVATLSLFAILVGIALFDVVGGVVVAGVAMVVYALLRLPAIDVLGSSDFVRSVVQRSAVFLGFGIFGGYAHRMVRRVLDGSPGNELLDPDTSCLSARAILYVLDSELARSQRYKREFCVIAIDLGEEVFGSIPEGSQPDVLRELGELLRTTIRATDHAAIISMQGRDRILLILPETPRSGAEVFLPRLADKVSGLLLNRNAAMPRKTGEVFSADADASHIRRLRNEVARAADVPMLIDLGPARN